MNWSFNIDVLNTLCMHSVSDWRSGDVSVSDSDGAFSSSDFSRHSQRRHHCRCTAAKTKNVMCYIYFMTLLALIIIVTVNHRVTFWIPPFYQRPALESNHLCLCGRIQVVKYFYTAAKWHFRESRGVTFYTFYMWHFTRGDWSCNICRRCCWQTYLSEHRVLSTSTEQRLNLSLWLWPKFQVVQKINCPLIFALLWSFCCELCPLDWALFTGDQCDNRCSPSPHRPLFVAF